MGFAVLHIKKGKSGAKGLGNHIDRTMNVPNADPNLLHKNFYVRHIREENTLNISKDAELTTLQERIDTRIKDGYKGQTAIRKDAVTHLNIILSGSHEPMKDMKSKGKINRWAFDNYKFIGKEFGYQNIVEFGVHMDERTPHIHAVVVPLTKNGRLSAKVVMGDKVDLSNLQTRYGELMEKLHGLKRGVKGSKATHDSIKEYYARINQSLEFGDLHQTPDLTYRPFKINKPPLFGRNDWVNNQNKAIREDYKETLGNILEEVVKIKDRQINHYQSGLIQSRERENRLVKEKAQLEGIIQEQDKIINPKKYIALENRRLQKKKEEKERRLAYRNRRSRRI